MELKYNIRCNKLQTGSVVIGILIATILLSFFVLIWTVSIYYLQKMQMQNAALAGATAGFNYLKDPNETTTQAFNYATINYPATSAVIEPVIGCWVVDFTACEGSKKPNAVKVTITDAVSLLGMGPVNITVSAVAYALHGQSVKKVVVGRVE